MDRELATGGLVTQYLLGKSYGNFNDYPVNLVRAKFWALVLAGWK